MLSFAKNERGIRMVSAAMLLLPIVCMLSANSQSAALIMTVFVTYGIFAVASLIAFICELSEERFARVRP